MISVLKKTFLHYTCPRITATILCNAHLLFFGVNQIRSELGIKDVICYVGVCVVDVRQLDLFVFFHLFYY